MAWQSKAVLEKKSKEALVEESTKAQVVHRLQVAIPLLEAVTRGGGSRQVVAAASSALFRLVLGDDAAISSEIETYAEVLSVSKVVLGENIGVSNVCSALKDRGCTDLAKEVSQMHASRNRRAHPATSQIAKRAHNALSADGSTGGCASSAEEETSSCRGGGKLLAGMVDTRLAALEARVADMQGKLSTLDGQHMHIPLEVEADQLHTWYQDGQDGSTPDASLAQVEPIRHDAVETPGVVEDGGGAGLAAGVEEAVAFEKTHGPEYPVPHGSVLEAFTPATNVLTQEVVSKKPNSVLPHALRKATGSAEGRGGDNARADSVPVGRQNARDLLLEARLKASRFSDAELAQAIRMMPG